MVKLRNKNKRRIIFFENVQFGICFNSIYASCVFACCVVSVRMFLVLGWNALSVGMIMHRIQKFVWISCKAVTEDFEFHPRETRQNGNCWGLVSFVISWSAVSLMEEVITLAKLLGSVETRGRNYGSIAFKARFSFSRACNYLAFSA